MLCSRATSAFWRLGLPIFYLCVLVLTLGVMFSAAAADRPQPVVAEAHPSAAQQAAVEAAAPLTQPPQPQAPLGYPKNDEMYGACNPVQNCSCFCHVTRHPVNTATGNFWHTFAALAIPSRGRALEFDWTYNSLDALYPSSSIPMGLGWSHSYNIWIDIGTDNGVQKYQVHQENGSVARFYVADLTTDANTMATLSIDNKGNFVFAHKQGQDTYYFYPLNGQYGEGKLWLIVDRHGYQTNLSYSNTGILKQVTDSTQSRSLSFSYTVTGTTGYLTKVADPANRQVSFGYDTNGNLQTFVDEVGQVTTFSYSNANGPWVLKQMRDPRAGAVTNGYDTHNRVTSQLDAMNRLFTFSYVTGTNPIALTATVTSPLNRVTVYTYYTNTLRFQTENPGTDQHRWQYLYDDTPLTTTYHTGITATIDPLGHTWTQGWDSNGNLLRRTDPLGRTTRYAYDSGNNLTVMTNPLGIPITYTYSSTATGDLIQTARPLTQTGQIRTTTFGYDPYHAGDVITTTNSRGAQWFTYHDISTGYVLTATDPLGNSQYFRYDTIGRRTSAITPRGYTRSYAYNAYDAPTVVTNTRGYTTKYTYDPNRNPLTVTDANGHTTTYQYNADDELTRLSHPDGTYYDTGYNADGNVTTQTNELGQTTAYGYDSFDRLVSATDALTRTTQYGYDLSDRRTTMVDAKGRTTTFGYDNANQPTSIAYQTGTPNVSFSYDNASRRTSMIDGTGTTLYSYDSLDRPTAVHDGLGHNVGYDYDLANNLTRLTYFVGLPVTYTYNARNEMYQLQDWLGKTTTFAYDGDGNVIVQGSANRVEQDFNFDSEDVMTSTQVAYLPPGPSQPRPTGPTVPLWTDNYTRDPLELLQTTTDSLDAKRTYQYDSRNRLTSDQPSTANQGNSWQYDPATEITQTVYSLVGGTPATSTRTYDRANELTRLLQTQGGQTTKNITLTYDLNGNRAAQSDAAAGTTTNYTYDQADRLTNFNSARRYSYNGDGLRMYKTPVYGKGASTTFLWDAVGGLPLLLSDGNANYIYGPNGRLVEQVQGNTPTYYHLDQLGSVRALTNMSGALGATYSYDPYGTTISSTGTLVNPFRFTGQYQDDESGFYYLRARYYDPTSQQFLTMDPLRAATTQAYNYADGSPTNATDPSGLVQCIPYTGVCGLREPNWETGRMGYTAADIMPLMMYAPAGGVGGAGGGRAQGMSRPGSNGDNVEGGTNFAKASSGSSCDPPASTPVGGKGRYGMVVEPGTNAPTTINGRPYSGHAIDQMQGRGIPPSAVENAINEGIGIPGTGGRVSTTRYYDRGNGISVVVNNTTRNVVTVEWTR
ncbi:MAG: DUF6531 domain-containing protein [Chloroflexota bacterium]|nr:DUF6531 domain-containing protein [Chloroflexota bacterium]